MLFSYHRCNVMNTILLIMSKLDLWRDEISSRKRLIALRRRHQLFVTPTDRGTPAFIRSRASPVAVLRPGSTKAEI
jgi:hypothetical protein